MSPADQRLSTDQATVRQADLRLIEQLEFPAFGSEYELCFECQARLQFLPDRVLENHMAAAPGRLGAAERQMPVAQKLLRAVAMLREDSGADRDPEAMLARARRQRIVESPRDPFGKLRDRAAEVGAADGNRKFVATQTRDEAGAVGLRGQPLGD